MNGPDYFPLYYLCMLTLTFICHCTAQSQDRSAKDQKAACLYFTRDVLTHLQHPVFMYVII